MYMNIDNSLAKTYKLDTNLSHSWHFIFYPLPPFKELNLHLNGMASATIHLDFENYGFKNNIGLFQLVLHITSFHPSFKQNVI